MFDVLNPRWSLPSQKGSLVIEKLSRVFWRKWGQEEALKNGLHLDIEKGELQ